MSIEENKKTVRSIFEADLATVDIDRLVDQLFTPDFVDHNPEPWQAPGSEGVKQYIRELNRAFPDIKFTLKDIIAEGDKVATRTVVTGTHKGDFSGIPPTGKTFSVDDFDVFRVVDGKIVEHWGILDTHKMLVQLGAISEAEAA